MIPKIQKKIWNFSADSLNSGPILDNWENTPKYALLSLSMDFLIEDCPCLNYTVDCSDAHTISGENSISFPIKFWNHSAGPDTILPKLTLCYIILAICMIWLVFGMYFSNFMTYFWMLWCRKYIKVIWFLNCVVLKKEVKTLFYIIHINIYLNGVSNLFRPRVFQSKENTVIDLLWPVVFIELSITKSQIILH